MTLLINKFKLICYKIDNTLNKEREIKLYFKTKCINALYIFLYGSDIFFIIIFI